MPGSRGLLPLLLVATACTVPEETGPTEPEWIPLFDGATLDGWTPKVRGYAAGEDPLRTFRVRDGAIVVDYGDYEGRFDDRFGHLFHDMPWEAYRLRVEYRFVGEQMAGGPGWAWRNSGLMLHGQSAASMALDQDFPASIEVQLLGADGVNERRNANLCTPYTHVEMDGQLVTRHCTDSVSRSYPGDDWVTVEVEVRGGESIRHLLDGEEVLAYQAPQLDPNSREAQALIPADGTLLLRGGTLSLQSESHPVEFRRVEVLPLTAAAVR